MKQILLCGATLLIFCSGFAQERDSISCDNYAGEALKNIYIGMPDYREVNSGSKLVVTYEGEWPAEMQGAFEHAVKIWEEVLPMTLPIHITANVGSLRGSGNILSRVSFDTFNFNGERVKQYACPITMTKSVILQEYHSGGNYRFMEDISDTAIFDGVDMVITYNQSMINQFDFSLDGNINLAKYDFVTVALRDIAIGLGFTTSFTADTSKKELKFPGGRFTPFQTLVMNAIGSSDSHVAYNNATKGYLNIPLLDWGNVTLSDTLTLYAPTTWSNNTSLRYFIPDDNPITKLLTYDFGKGYIMRDLSGVNWDDLFCSALDWRKDLTVGSASGSASHAGTTSDTFPYRGTVSLTFNNNDRASFTAQEQKLSFKGQSQSFSSDEATKTIETQSSFPAKEFCKKYDAFSPDGPLHLGLSLSVMKKDGSWDCVYKTIQIDDEPIFINIEDLTLNFDQSDYARGTTGGLRYRLTKCEQQAYSQNICYKYRTKYFTRDFTPQKAFIKYTPQQSIQRVNPISLTGYDDWFIDVEVGISNLEGTKRVFVEQLDEGEILPFQYEVTDFRKGYFVANLDRECSTTLTIICYNDNGYQRSNTIVIPAIGYPTSNVSIKKSGDIINIEGLSDIDFESKGLSYTIKNIALTGQSDIVKTLDMNSIDISDLKKAIYVLVLQHGSEQIATFKFAR